jgi:protease I
MFDGGKTVAAVCHGPWMLAEADVLGGRSVTSWPSIRTDLVNAGAEWVDREVVEDGNLITSRKPADLPAFSDAIQRHLSSMIVDREARFEGRDSEEHPTI